MAADELADEAAADLLADTHVARVREETDAEPALYRCSLPPHWNAALFPFGGVAAAIALRALRQEVDSPEQPPRSVTTVFSSPVKDGKIEIEVRTLRRGRGMSQLQATLRNAGQAEAGHTTLAVFGASREGFEFTDATPPDIPEPADCREPLEPPDGYRALRASFFEQLEVRGFEMKAPWETDWEAGRPARALRWMRYRNPPRRAGGTIDPIAYLPVCDTMPPSLGQRLGPGFRAFLAPSCDLNVHLLGETTSDWWIADGRTHYAGDGYTSSTLELWDAERRLLARAHQTMYVRMDVPELRG